MTNWNHLKNVRLGKLLKETKFQRMDQLLLRDGFLRLRTKLEIKYAGKVG